MHIENFLLRRVHGGDQNAVVQLIGNCYAEYNEVLELDSLDADLNPIMDHYGGRARPFFVLLDEHEIIASVALAEKSVTVTELKRVFLLPRYRGRGLGKALSRFACAWAKDHGYRTLHIWSDTLFHTAHGLYRSLGAECIGHRPLGGRNDCSEWGFTLTL